MRLIKILLVISISCILLSSCKDFQSNDLPFNQNEWKKGDARIRGRMYRDLVDRKFLLGKTRSEVIELLGEPTEDDPTYIKYQVDFGSIVEGPLQKYYMIAMFNKGKVEIVTVID